MLHSPVLRGCCVVALTALAPDGIIMHRGTWQHKLGIDRVNFVRVMRGGNSAGNNYLRL
jgi:hypothetical protein